MARNDIHSPKNFNPGDYEYVDHFGHMPVPNMDRQDGEPHTMYEPYGEHVMQEYIDRGDGKDNPHADMQQCDLCGARFVNGAGLIHKPTGLLIVVGGQCMEGIAGIRSLSKGQKWDRVKRDRKRRERAAKMRAMLVANPGINAALKTDHYISQDLRAKALEWGDLSEKQVALAFKLAKDVSDREPELETRPVPVTDKRVKVEGQILGTKLVDGYGYGQQIEKMLVQVPVDGGAYKLWMTVPQALADAQWDEERKRTEAFQALVDEKLEGLEGDVAKEVAEALEKERQATEFWAPLKGAAIEFVARLEPSEKDEAFGFAKRPTKAVVVKWAE